VQGEKKRVVTIKTRIFGCHSCQRELAAVTTNFAGSDEVIVGVLSYHQSQCYRPDVVFMDKSMTIILNEDMWSAIEANEWYEASW
jgi:hypothetical protein